MRKRYGWWLLGACAVTGVASVVGLVRLYASTPPSPSKDAVERLERIRPRMSPKEVLGIMGAPGVDCVSVGSSDYVGIYHLGNGWALEVTFGDCGLEKTVLYRRRYPPWYRCMWDSLQEMNFSPLPDLPF
jgi:hypothetical protein